MSSTLFCLFDWLVSDGLSFWSIRLISSTALFSISIRFAFSVAHFFSVQSLSVVCSVLHQWLGRIFCCMLKNFLLVLPALISRWTVNWLTLFLPWSNYTFFDCCMYWSAVVTNSSTIIAAPSLLIIFLRIKFYTSINNWDSNINSFQHWRITLILCFWNWCPSYSESLDSLYQLPAMLNLKPALLDDYFHIIVLVAPFIFLITAPGIKSMLTTTQHYQIYL